MVADRAKMAIDIQWEVMHRLSIGTFVLALTSSKGHGRGHRKVDCEYLENGDRNGKLPAYCQQI